MSFEARPMFSRDLVDVTEQPMFFGTPVNVARYDVSKYPIFNKLTDLQHAAFWRPEEINLDQDAVQFNKQLSDHERFIFVENLSYQILLDSVQGRAPVIAFLPYVSIPELEPCISAWAFMETIHSRSYTHILRNVFNNPKPIFDGILGKKEIMDRALAVTQYYDSFITYAKLYELFGVGDHSLNGEKITITTRELKKKLYMALMSVYVLESVRFYVSFACAFALAERGLMKGNADIISLIARDEAMHIGISSDILKFLSKKEQDLELTSVIAESQDAACGLFAEAATQEKNWASYIFSKGSIIGLNEKILNEYIEHMVAKRMTTVGLEPIFAKRPNPIDWIDNWLDTSTKQVRPQEVQVINYEKGGGTVNDLGEKNPFEGFSL